MSRCAKSRQPLEAAVILAMCLDRTLIDGADPEWFSGTARDAFQEIKAAVGNEESIGFANLRRLLQDQYGVVPRNGEKVKDAVKRVLTLEADARRLRSEYLKKRMELGKRTTAR